MNYGSAMSLKVMSSRMTDAQVFSMLVEYRRQMWTNHCNYVLQELLLPNHKILNSSQLDSSKRSIVIIENRIDSQWLFTVLNSALMCPFNTRVCIVSDNKNQEKAKQLLAEYNLNLNIFWLPIEKCIPNAVLQDSKSFNALMKEIDFWESLPYEDLLFIQTDALLTEPIPKYFFKFEYLGAPFLPRQQSEYFQTRNKYGDIVSFFKVETPIHCSPNPDVYPHLYGNGGLSIRNRTIMKKICENHGACSPQEEQEDVFFSRHMSKYCKPAPLQIAQAFASESMYQSTAIGSHAAWKYFSSAELADHLDKHWRQVWAMVHPKE